MDIMINGTTIEFTTVKEHILSKTSYSEKGIQNVIKSMASEFLMDQTEYLVRIQLNDDVLHFVSKKLEDRVEVMLKDIYKADFYLNSGILTENVTRKNIENLH